MNTNIFEVEKSVIAFHQSNGSYSGEWYAGDGEQWIKCGEFETAQATNLKYIFFVSGNKAKLYKG